MPSPGGGPLDVQRYLLRDERILWGAHPVKKYFLKYVLSQDPSRWMGYYFFFFGLLFAVLPWLSLLGRPTPDPKGEIPFLVFTVFGLLFAGIGYSLSFARRRRALKQFASTAYYLTNKRALIISGMDHPTLTAIELRRVPQVSLSLVDGTIGNIVFGEADPAIRRGLWRVFDWSAWWGRGEKQKLEGFIAIGGAEDIMRRIAEAEDGLK